ncbi:hypothetical protein IQ07DRAFT_13119 [Pyrenochaeta sp. DS3sAY3a]|nr:hypothetical protein IQ07DRAFT_13119 [Pyrenochaeta sp. DS3sAY3a]
MTVFRSPPVRLSLPFTLRALISALITNPFRDTTIAYRNHPNQHTHPRICDAYYDYPFRDTHPDSQLRTVHCDITPRYLVHQYALRYPPLRYNPIIPSPPATSPPRTLSRSIPSDISDLPIATTQAI